MLTYIFYYSTDPSCVSSRVLGQTGSWAGPAWFKMLLGLGGRDGVGGGGGVCILKNKYIRYLKYYYVTSDKANG